MVKFVFRIDDSGNKVESRLFGGGQNRYGDTGMHACQSCLTLCNPMHCGPPESSVHGVIQAIILEWAAFFFSTRQIQVSTNTDKYRDPPLD